MIKMTEKYYNIPEFNLSVKDNYSLVTDYEMILELSRNKPVIINMTGDDRKTDEYIRVTSYVDPLTCEIRHLIQHRTQLDCDTDRHPQVLDLCYSEAKEYLATF